MEDLVESELFANVYRGKRVLITGHTGFKGSWLSMWLTHMGARVIGYSKDIPTSPSHFEAIGLKGYIDHVIGDVRDFDLIKKVINQYKPELIFHMAAQSLVRKSYTEPMDTYSSNVIGTVNVLEVVRQSCGIKGIVNVTSDKCYENTETGMLFKESDRLGGYDPYSASKACAEIVSNSYRNSFFNINEYKKTHNVILASVRSGNVIGGGDWSENRLIPDIIRAVYSDNTTIIRSPHSTRPWQHVLDPLAGYLLLGQHILEENIMVSDAWNFGPHNEESLAVIEVVSECRKNWGKVKYEIEQSDESVHEAILLGLDCSKAHESLLWYPMYSPIKAIEETIQWYKHFKEGDEVITSKQINDYVRLAKSLGASWTS